MKYVTIDGMTIGMMDVQLFKQEMADRCPYRICDGGGYVEEGDIDNVYVRRCACNPKVEEEFNNQD